MRNSHKHLHYKKFQLALDKFLFIHVSDYHFFSIEQLDIIFCYFNSFPIPSLIVERIDILINRISLQKNNEIARHFEECINCFCKKLSEDEVFTVKNKLLR